MTVMSRAKATSRGWVDGMPPGQAKKSGEGKGRDHEYDGSDPDGHDHHDGQGDVAEQPAPDGGHDGTQAPATSEEILTDIAKEEAARRACAAAGSEEEALINLGADAIINRSKNK